MTTLRARALLGLTLFAAAGCTATDLPASDAGLDAPDALAPGDAGTDTSPPLDASMSRDARPPDARTDAPSVGVVEAAVSIFCGPWSEARCAERWGCGCDLDLFGPPPTDVAACRADEAFFCDLAHEYSFRFEDTFAEHGAVLDAAALERCLAATREAYAACEPRPPFPGDETLDCSLAVTEGSPIGAPCSLPELRCARGDGACIAGRCTALPGSDAPCGGACARGLSCVAGRCATSGPPGARCADHEDCATGRCIAGVCGGARGAEGEPCDASRACATGLECSSGVCTATLGTCADGERCGEGRHCEHLAFRVCRASTGLGDACFDHEGCAPGLHCDTRENWPGVCAPIPGPGDECLGVCPPGLLCRGDRRTSDPAHCLPPLDLGDTCEEWGAADLPVCADGLSCLAGLCRLAPGLGERCDSGFPLSDDFVCESGLGCQWDAASTSFVCAPPQPAGGECWGGPLLHECAAGLVCERAGDGPGRCVSLPTLGAPCDGRCAGDLECRTDPATGTASCRALPIDGELCEHRCEGALVCAPDVRHLCVADVCEALRDPTLWP